MEEVTAEEAKVLLGIWNNLLKGILNSIHLFFPSPTGCSKAEVEKGKDLTSGCVFPPLQKLLMTSDKSMEFLTSANYIYLNLALACSKIKLQETPLHTRLEKAVLENSCPLSLFLVFTSWICFVHWLLSTATHYEFTPNDEQSKISFED